jgi:hypothetical protein
MTVDRLPDIAHFQSSFEAIAGLGAVMEEHLQGEFPHFVVGGIATAALVHPDTVIDVSTRRIIAAEAADIPTRRPNGTMRDVDVLIGGVVHQSLMQQAKTDIEQATAQSLEASVFSFDAYHSHMHEKSGWISRRLQQTNETVSYQLGPIIQHVQPTSYEPWTLELPKGMGEVSVLNPVGQLAAYAMRSISGIRAKDTEKFAQMRTNILQYRELKNDLHHGPFKEWKQFADTLTAIRRGQPLEYDNIQPGTTRRDIAMLRWRGRLLKMVEQHPFVVDVAQKPGMQKALNTFVRAAK